MNSKIYSVGDEVTVKAEWRDGDEDGKGYVVVEDRGDRLAVTHKDFSKWAVTPVETIGKDMIETE